MGIFYVIHGAALYDKLHYEQVSQVRVSFLTKHFLNRIKPPVV